MVLVHPLHQVQWWIQVLIWEDIGGRGVVKVQKVPKLAKHDVKQWKTTEIGSRQMPLYPPAGTTTARGWTYLVKL